MQRLLNFCILYSSNLFSRLPCGQHRGFAAGGWTGFVRGLAATHVCVGMRVCV